MHGRLRFNITFRLFCLFLCVSTLLVHSFVKPGICVNTRPKYLLSRRALVKAPQNDLISLPHTPFNSPFMSKLTTVLSPYSQSTLFHSVAVNVILSAALLISKQRLLTPNGTLHAAALGIILWSTLGMSGWLFCVAYFAFGSLVTRVKLAEKERLGIAEKREGARGPENVWGSAMTSMLCAVMSSAFPAWKKVLVFGYVAGLASKCADTVSSEIGKAFGRRTFLITSLKPVPKGTDGAISLEGTLAGLVASGLMAFIAASLNLVPLTFQSIGTIVASAFIANIAESYIGAIFQKDSQFMNVSNELVNFLMTLIGASLSIALTKLLNT